MDNQVAPELLDDIALQLSPKPTIAIVADGSADSLLVSMRNGADSVFTQDEMASTPSKLVYCIERQLQRAARIDEVGFLRDSLSNSLEELKSEKYYDITLVNDDFEKAIKELDKIINGGKN